MFRGSARNTPNVFSRWLQVNIEISVVRSARSGVGLMHFSIRTRY
jgi:hypothetical protein